MDYKKIYDNLMQKGLDRTNLTEYFERHHIIPKCLDGCDNESNLVKLTYKEHYMAHYLLIKIYPENYKMYYAFLCMLRNSSGKRKFTAGMYATIKRNYSDMRKWSPNQTGMTIKGKKSTAERMKGDGNPMRRFPEKNPFLGKSYVADRKWYNNGEVNMYIKNGDLIPDGYIPGMVYRPRKKKGES